MSIIEKPQIFTLKMHQIDDCLISGPARQRLQTEDGNCIPGIFL